MRFSPDGERLLVAECRSNCWALFTVGGLLFQRVSLGAGPAGCEAPSDHDVSFGAGGEVMVAHNGAHSIMVFSADGSILLKTWGAPGIGTGEFQHPRSLAVAGPCLYFMDDSRVQVFV